MGAIDRWTMEWSQDFETDLADIDVQHRYLFSLVCRINQLDDSTEQVALRSIADELCRLALCHFGCEELLMTAYNYPNAPRHKAEHDKLVSVVQEFKSKHEYHARELALFLCNWLVSHTMLEDRQLAQHVLMQRARAMGMSVPDFVEGVKLYTSSMRYSGTLAIGSRAIAK
jgi:hemerythrin